jgi:hypothetical protein
MFVAHTVTVSAMNTVLQSLRPQQAFKAEDGDEHAGQSGYGNLSRTGAIESMNVPRVLDVSQRRSNLLRHAGADIASLQLSSTPTQILCRQILRQRSSSPTERRLWHSGSKEESLSL